MGYAPVTHNLYDQHERDVDGGSSIRYAFVTARADAGVHRHASQVTLSKKKKRELRRVEAQTIFIVNISSLDLLLIAP
jgi:hypothetical protein